MQDNDVKVLDKDVQLIRDTFLDNDDLLKAMRKLAFGLDTSDSEKSMVKSAFSSKELYDAIRRRFLPKLSDDNPIGQIGYTWNNMYQFIVGEYKDNIAQKVGHKQISEDLTKQALRLFTDPNGEPIKLELEPNDDPLQIQLIAETHYINHIGSQLYFLKQIAENNRLTKSEVMTKNKKDSSE